MSHYPVYLPAQREPRGQDEVVLELTAGAEIAAVEIVFPREPQTNRRRERNPQTEAGDAAPIRDAFAFAGHVMTTANECRATTQEDADPRRCGRQAEHQLGAADEHLRVAIAVNLRAGSRDVHARGREPAGELEPDRAPAPKREPRAANEAVVAADIRAHAAEMIPGRDIGARPRCDGEAALRGGGRCAQRLLRHPVGG